MNETAAWVGNSLNNVIDAGTGNNILNGGAGTDTLSYAYATASVTANLALSEMGLGALRDVIGDFKTVEGDKIDLSTLDANLATTANDAFSFIGSSAFSGNATAQLRFAGGILYGSTDADTAPGSRFNWWG
jgi:Ca2+-binding RTX toxin-like protein